MLAALLLMGLLPLAAIPLLGGESDADDDTDQGAEANALAESDTGETAPMATALGGALAAGSGAGATEFDAGELIQLQGEAGAQTVAEFEPGIDILELDFTAADAALVYEGIATPEGATASFQLGGGTVGSIFFEGLAEVPVDDIMLKIADATQGGNIELSLTDALAGAEVLTAPEAPAVQAEIAPGRETASLDVLQPLNPDTEAQETLDPNRELATGPTDPDTVLDPLLPDGVIDPTTPDTVVAPISPDPAGPDPLQPIGPYEEVFGTEGDLELRALLEHETENSVGIGAALSAAFDTGVTDTELSNVDDTVAMAEGTGATTGMTMPETAPVITSDMPIEVIDGGAGDDAITTGSNGAYAFGGEGADTLTAGSGHSSLYGGADDDVLLASDTGGYLDGGAGNDWVTGGAGDDTLEGGEHSGWTTTGADTLDGGAGDDFVRGGYGADVLSGGTGDDFIDHQGRTEERASIPHSEFAWHTGADADSLSGGEGDDTLVFDRHDEVAGGAGADTFWLYHDGAAGPNVAEVTDFQVGQDFLRVSLNPQIGENGTPVVEVRASADGEDGEVIVNGDLVAILRGAPGATTSDIFASVEPDVFP